MRTILNLSVPNQIKLEMEGVVKNGDYATLSELFREMWRDRKAQQLLIELSRSRWSIARGKGKTLESLKDLR